MNWQNTLIGYFFNATRHGWSFSEAQNGFEKWKKSLSSSSMADEKPWVNLVALDFFEKNVRPGDRVFEFGGGGSTLYFLKKVGPEGFVATVEHDEKWMAALRETVEKKGLKNWASYFAAPEKRPDGPPSDPDGRSVFGSRSPEFLDFSFKKYAQTIQNWPDEHFDLVLVDGRSRPSCAFESLKKVKIGGILAIDNVERTRYFEPLADVLERDFELVSHRFGPTLFHPSWTATRFLRRKK